LFRLLPIDEEKVNAGLSEDHFEVRDESKDSCENEENDKTFIIGGIVLLDGG
jgi:hypothetical protein